MSPVKVGLSRTGASILRITLGATTAAGLAALLSFQVAAHWTGAGGEEKPIGIVLAVGDISNCGDDPDNQKDENVAAIIAENLAEARRLGIPLRLALMGDLAYPAGTKANFMKCFDPQWRKFKNIMLPVPGNHEYTAKLNGKEYNPEPEPVEKPLKPRVNKKPGVKVKPILKPVGQRRVPRPVRKPLNMRGKTLTNTSPGARAEVKPIFTIEDLEHAKPYFDYFKDLPKNNEGKPLVESEGPRTGYYAVRFPARAKGAWLMIGLNTYTRSKAKPEWEDWLEEKLKANDRLGRRKARCILAFSHNFRYSSGLHGHHYNEKDSNAKLGDRSHMKPAYEILTRHKTSVILGGHDHHFEQFPRMDNYGDKSQDGIRSFVVGTGGTELYLDAIKRRYGTEYKEVSEHTEHLIPDKHGVLRIDLYPKRYTWKFLAIDGSQIIPRVHEDRCR